MAAVAQTSMGTYSGPISNIIDGSTSTYWWSNGSASAGSYVGVDLGAIMSVAGNITITMDQPNTGDYITHGDLRVSQDGVDWTTLVSGTSRVVSYTGPAVTARFIRYVATASNSPEWVKVNEIAYTATALNPSPFSWTDGAQLHPATLAGWVDGTGALQPATVKGWWDGTQIQSIG